MAQRRTTTVCVIGLSGTELVKGAEGVGKSLLCNRFVRGAFDDFHEEHISTLSQVRVFFKQEEEVSDGLRGISRHQQRPLAVLGRASSLGGGSFRQRASRGADGVRGRRDLRASGRPLE